MCEEVQYGFRHGRYFFQVYTVRQRCEKYRASLEVVI